MAAYRSLARWAHGDPWLEAVVEQARQRLRHCSHGDFERWKSALERLPPAVTAAELDRAEPILGAMVDDPAALRSLLQLLHPWRKGPLRLGGVDIETEWRSDWKWQRLSPHVDLHDACILDIGCGNGYYGWRMLGAGARRVVGIDPTWVFVMQWLASRHFAGDLPNHVLPLRFEDLPAGAAPFDVLFSLGVLYHRRDPVAHLQGLHRLLGGSGTLVLESLVLPPDQAEELLLPPGRYARMRNVWAVPGTERLLDWLRKAGFSDSVVVDRTVTTPQEQRRTAWMRFESLEEALDPENPQLTVEGHPAPERALLIARA